MVDLDWDQLRNPDQDYGQGSRWLPAEKGLFECKCPRLRIERYVGRWSGSDRAGEWFQLIDTATDTMLLDTAEIPNVDLLWLDDDKLLFKARLEEREAAFRLDLRDRTFRNLAHKNATGPLTDFSAALSKHLRLINDGEPSPNSPNDRRESAYSPYGDYRLDFQIGESGHGVPHHYFALVLIEENETIFECWPWQHVWHRFGRTTMGLTTVASSKYVTLWLAPLARRGSIGAGNWVSLDVLKQQLADARYSQPPARPGSEKWPAEA